MSATAERSAAAAGVWFGPAASRAVLFAALAAGAGCGLLATGSDAATLAVAEAGGELTRLLRAMAGLKLLMAAAAGAGIAWRLGAAVTPAWLGAYAASAFAMAAGPGLIWDMAHVGAGAALLHGGLAAALLLLWRDPATRQRLDAMLAARRLARSR